MKRNVTMIITMLAFATNAIAAEQLERYTPSGTPAKQIPVPTVTIQDQQKPVVQQSQVAVPTQAEF